MLNGLGLCSTALACLSSSGRVHEAGRLTCAATSSSCRSSQRTMGRGKAVSHGWPHRTGGRIARVAASHRWPHCTRWPHRTAAAARHWRTMEKKMGRTMKKNARRDWAPCHHRCTGRHRGREGALSARLASHIEVYSDWPYCTGGRIARVAASHGWPYCTADRLTGAGARCWPGSPATSRRTTTGRIARVAALHGWPYRTGGRIAQVALLHSWPSHRGRGALLARLASYIEAYYDCVRVQCLPSMVCNRGVGCL